MMFQKLSSYFSPQTILRIGSVFFLVAAVFLSAMGPSDVLAQSNDDYSISVSDTSIEEGDTVTVDFDVDGDTDRRDWIGLFEEGDRNRDFIDFEYTDGDESGSRTFTIDDAGEYEFRYLIDDGFTSRAESETVTVTRDGDDDDDDDDDNGSGGDDYSISVSDTSIEEGDTVTVDFDVDGDTDRRDWIGLFEEGDRNRDFIDFEYTDGDESGSRTFTIDDAGEYEFRYLIDDGFTSRAESETVTVTRDGDDDDDDDDDNGSGGDDYSISVSDTSIEEGDTVTVDFDVDGDTDRRDWIGLFEEGDRNRDFIDFEYTDGDESGSRTFTIDDAGEYEFRYLIDDGFTSRAESETVTVTRDGDDDDDDDDDNGSGGDDYSISVSDTSIEEGDTVTVDFDVDGDTDRRDWIGLFEEGDRNRDFIDFEYTDGDESGSRTFTIDDAGEYEFRYLIDDGFTSRAESETVTVTRDGDDDDDDDDDNGSGGDDYSISVSDTSIEEGDTVTVDFDVDGDTDRRDWIGLFEEGDRNRDFIDFEYTDGDESGSRTFTIDDAGEYEFRYLIDDGFTSRAESETVTVTRDGDDDDDDDDDNGSGGDDYSISVSDTSIEEGDTVTVDFDVDGDTDRRDWIGLFEEGDRNRDFIDFEYTDGDESGSRTFTIDDAGEYEFRYLIDDGFTSRAESETVTVTRDGDDDDDDDDDNGSGGDDYSISVSDTSIEEGDTVTVDFDVDGDTDRRDWIGLFEEGDRNRDFIDFEYTDGDESGSRTFTIDDAGEYEFRYLIDDGFTSRAESETVTVTRDGDDDDDDDDDNGSGGDDYSISVSDTSIEEGDTVTVDFDVDGDTDRRDWIGLFEEGDRNRDFIDFEYTDGDESGSRTFTIDDAGEYEFRYLIDDGFTSRAESETVTVTRDGDDDDDDDDDNGSGGGNNNNSQFGLALTKNNYDIGEDIDVNWQVDSSERRLDNFIGLYRPGDDDEDFIDFKYTFSIFDDGDRTFRINAPGEYEFRLFLDNQFDRVATTDTFTVGGGSGGGQCPLSQNELNDITNYPPGNGPVIAFGDSLTAGVGASSGQDYVSELERSTGVTIQNAGVSGDTTRDALDRLDQDVLSEDPSTVIVWLGGNDILRRAFQDAENNLDADGRAELRRLILQNGGSIPDGPVISQSESFDNLREIIDRIQDNGAVVILVGFNAGIYNSDLQDDYEDLARDTDSIYVENALRGVVGRPSLMADLVHPNNQGYDIVASRIAPAFNCTQQ